MQGISQPCGVRGNIPHLTVLCVCVCVWGGGIYIDNRTQTYWQVYKPCPNPYGCVVYPEPIASQEKDKDQLLWRLGCNSRDIKPIDFIFWMEVPVISFILIDNPLVLCSWLLVYLSLCHLLHTQEDTPLLTLTHTHGQAINDWLHAPLMIHPWRRSFSGNGSIKPRLNWIS